MGGSQSDCDIPIPLPDTRNICNVPIGGYNNINTGMTGFCTNSKKKYDGIREEYCGAMGNYGEWIVADFKPSDKSCYYDKCNGVLEVPSNVCCQRCKDSACDHEEKCCGNEGIHTVCQRVKYTGDPVICCLSDYDCRVLESSDPQYDPSCFSDPCSEAPQLVTFTSESQFTVLPNHTCQNRTCDPQYRSIVNRPCREKLHQYCTGTLPSDDPNSTDWLDRWDVNSLGSRSCPYALARNMYNPKGDTGHCPAANFAWNPINGCQSPPPYPIDSEGYFWGQRVVTEAMEKYTLQGFRIGALPGSSGYNPFQDILYNNVCCPNPGLCQNGLTELCGQYNSAQVSIDPTIAQWCGCHMAQEQYQEYSVNFNIPPQCTPMCNRIGTVPIVGINADPVLCEQQICIIDDVTVNLINAQIQGGLNFNQICGNCGNATCSCIISNSTLDIQNSTIQGNVIPINSGCGSFLCTQTNPGPTGPTTINVPCGTGINPYLEYEQTVLKAQATAQKRSSLWTFLVIGLGLLLIFLFILFIHPNLYPESGNYIILPPTTQSIQPTQPSTTQPSTTQSSTTQPSSQFLSQDASTNTIFLPRDAPTNTQFLPREAPSKVDFLRHDM